MYIEANVLGDQGMISTRLVECGKTWIPQSSDHSFNVCTLEANQNEESPGSKHETYVLCDEAIQ